jgi:hypothetical protein
MAPDGSRGDSETLAQLDKKHDYLGGRVKSISSAEAMNSRSAYQLRSRNNEFTASGRMPVTCDREWALN